MGYQLVCSMQSRNKRLVLPRGPTCINHHSSVITYVTIARPQDGALFSKLLPKGLTETFPPLTVRNCLQVGKKNLQL